MVHILFYGQHNWPAYLRIANAVIVYISNASACLVVIVKMAQLYTEYRSLYLVEPAITASVLEDVLSLAAIVGQCTNSVGQQLVVAGHGAAITQCSHILSRIEAMTGSIAKRPGPATICITAAMSLSIVFHQLKAVVSAQASYFFGISTSAI